jgi:hypothetical protein
VVHLQENGFEVQLQHVTDAQLAEIKRQYAIPPALEGCHTGVVGGYVVEGHVPADVLRRLLAEKPEVAGLAVPGMPAGSPGMEGAPAVPFDVLTFTQDGRTSIYDRR